MRQFAIVLLFGASFLLPAGALRAEDPNIPEVAAGPEEDANVIEVFNVDRNGGFLLIPVNVGERQYQFVLDTGTAVSVFDSSLKDEFWTTAAKVPCDGDSSFVSLCHCRNATVGRSRSLNLWQDAVCADLHEFREQSGHDIRGFLGMDFLKQRVVQIDINNGRVAILKSAEKAPGEKIPIRVAVSGKAINCIMFEIGATSAGTLRNVPAVHRPQTPIRISAHRCPVVEIGIPDTGFGAFFLDTASSGSKDGELAPPTFELLTERGCFSVSESPVSGSIDGADSIDRIKKTRSGTLAELRMGDLPIGGASFTEGKRNLLGRQWMSRYKLTYDLPNQVLYVAKGVEPTEKRPDAALRSPRLSD